MHSPRSVFCIMCLLVVWGLFLPVLLEATTTRRETVSCPVCSQEVQGTVINSTNTFGGRDRDLCPHARGTNALPLSMWFCGNCRFAGYRNQFTATMTADAASDLKSRIAGDKQISAIASAPEAWEKYAVAARIAELQGASAAEIGRLYLRAAWCCRFAMRIPKRGVEGPNPMAAFGEETNQLIKLVESKGKDLFKRDMNGAESDLLMASLTLSLVRDGTATPKQAPVWIHLAALLYRMHGEHRDALAIIAESAKHALPAPLEENLTAMRAGIDLEKKYQSIAVEWLQKSLATTTINPEEAQVLALQIADTLRRLGREEEATKALLKLLESTTLAEGLEEIARVSLKALGASFTESPALMAAKKSARLERIIADLKSPDKGRDAGFALMHEPDPELIPPLLELFRTGTDETRENVVIALVLDDQRVLEALREQFDKPCLRERILYNFSRIGNPNVVPFLLEKFPRVHKPKAAQEFISTLMTFGGPDVTKALLERAETLFYAGMIEEAQRDRDRGECFSELAQALGMTDDKAALPLLDRLLELATDEVLANAAGRAIETLTNHYHGFSNIEGPGVGEAAEIRHGLAFEARPKWKEWLAANGSDSRDLWLEKGFQAVGYQVFPASDPVRLDELVRGLADPRDFIRYNSWMELYRRTGVAFNRSTARNNYLLASDFRPLREQYETWLRANSSRLVWDAATNRFTVRQTP